MTSCCVTPLPLVEVKGNLEYKIAEVLNSKIDRCQRCKLLYLVWWAGYEGTDDETSWLPTDELTHAPETLVDFHWLYPDKPRPSI